MSDRVVAVLGRGVVPSDTPILRADDLGVLRGDGVFETMHIRGGQPWLLTEHLARMARSAARLELDLPDTAALADLATVACEEWRATAPGADEAVLRMVCTRGPEAGGPVTVFATAGPLPPQVRGARRDGVAAVTATLGVAAAGRREAPWLLAGAKSLSYAVNMASLRWAQQHGVDDVLWTSSDGYALEAPTSTLVWLDSDLLCTVPAEEVGILPGTTARWLLDHAGRLGFTAAERMVRPEALVTADGVWLTSSVRGCVPVRSLDGAELRPSPHTAAIQELLSYPV